MKILVVGDGHSPIHEVAVAEAFRKLGHHVETFYWQSYFYSQNSLVRLWLRAQNKFLVGPMLKKLNTDLVDCATRFEPELVFIYRGTHVTPETISTIKHTLLSCVVYGYNNDDPFADGHPPWLWRSFLKSVPVYDLMFAYRKHNIEEYYSCGARRVELLMPWFIPEKDFPKMQGEPGENKYDIVYVGHYEPDDRAEYLKEIAESKYRFGLFGPDWGRAPEYDWLKRFRPVIPLRGELYRETICSASIALSFLSKLNRDTYTRRCFEIPAMGVFMLCQYSEDLASLYEDGVDAVFFKSPDDMMQKIDFYMRHEELRRQIAENGLRRVIRDRHDVVSRISYVLGFVER